MSTHETIGRRQFLQGIGRRALGLTGIALFGCADSTSQVEKTTTSSPPEGFGIYRPLNMPIEAFVPLDQDNFSIDFHSENIKNPKATVDDVVQNKAAFYRSQAKDVSIVSSSSTSQDSVQQKLSELGKIKMDGKDTRIIFAKATKTSTANFWTQTNVLALTVDKEKVWGILMSFINPDSNEDLVNYLSKMAVTMRSFRVLS